MYLGSVVEVLPDARTEPRHPYTRALMDSRPSPPTPPRAARSSRLSGEIPCPSTCRRAAPLPPAARAPATSAAARPLISPARAATPSPASIPSDITTRTRPHEFPRPHRRIRRMKATPSRRAARISHAFRRRRSISAKRLSTGSATSTPSSPAFSTPGAKRAGRSRHVVSAHATPGARVSREAFDHIAGLICDAAEEQGQRSTASCSACTARWCPTSARMAKASC